MGSRIPKSHLAIPERDIGTEENDIKGRTSLLATGPNWQCHVLLEAASQEPLFPSPYLVPTWPSKGVGLAEDTS